MSELLIILFSLQSLFYLIIAAFFLFVLFAAWRSFSAWRKKKLLSALVWSMIAIGPFVFYFIVYTAALNIENNRAELVANLDRASMPVQYPKLLEIHGFMQADEIILFLDMLKINRVLLFQSRPRNGELHGEQFKLVSECRGVGSKYLNLLRKGRRIKSTSSEQKYCLNKEKVSVSADRSSIPAIVFLKDHATTLRLPGNTAYAGGNFEARLRTVQKDILLDYWERPYLKKPSGPSSLGYLFPESTDWRKYRSPGRTRFFASAVGLL